jgi:hypothetical protein
VIRLVRWECLLFLSFLLCLGIGCGGGGGSQSGSGQTQNPVPVLSGVNPNSVTAGSTVLTITASGSGFISTSVIAWNGTALTTSYVSSTSLIAQVPVSDLSSAGTATVAVQTPAPGGGTSGVLSFTISAPANPTPTLTSLSPTSATAGSAAFTLTVTGTQFISTSQILWNGAALTTIYVSSTSLTAQVPASDLSSVGTVMVAVQTPAPGGGASSALTFSINQASTNLTILNIEGTDLAWNPSQQKLYVAVPSGASTNGGTVTIVDPIAGSILSAQKLSSAPSGLSVSDDSEYLYAVISGGSTIQRLSLPALTPDIQWSLGTDASSGNPNLAGDIKVQPGASQTLAVSFGEYGSGSIAVYDNAIERSSVTTNIGDGPGNSLQWKADGSELYAAYTISNDSPYYTTVSDDALYTMPVTSTGVGALTVYHSTFRAEGSHLHSDSTTGFVYGDWGEVVGGANGVPIGNYRYSRPSGTYFPGPLSVVDPSLKRFYTLLEVGDPSNGTLAFQIQVFDQTHCCPVKSRIGSTG